MTDPVDTPPVEVTIREITELVRQFEDSGWGSLELDIHGMHLVLGKEGAPRAVTVPTHAAAVAVTPEAGPTPAPVSAPAPPAAAATEPTPVPPATPTGAPRATSRSGAALIEVIAPVVGAFWAAPSPGEPPFVHLGDTVGAGQQLAIVEVMKLMSDVSAPAAGTIVEICAANAEMVEYDQVLFLIDPGADDA